MTPIGRDEAQGRAVEELLKPEYQKEDWLAYVLRIGRQFLGDLLDGTGSSAGGIVAAIVVGLVILALAGLVFWALRKAPLRRAPATGAIFGTKTMTAAEHRALAERMSAEQRWGEAVQERLRAIARDLEERALVTDMPGRTADELAAEAGTALPAFAGELAAAARSFDDVTYGGMLGTPTAYTTMTSLDQRLQAARPVPA
ncbi:DUF4129 domain-containing protein [Nonomuraea typhae]|uniref:DUF4129 domain-containing protein n=1 Tax=Nonomuraea typhae TaxID=2603600 RepID=UPI0012FAAB46|nr:DUF4129 domain-containing protein [Nonomuraea typhae]